nr:MAG TPA: hypothetical protein [Caudoviricetes sp.]
MSLGHEQILNPPSSDILVRLICGDAYDKERGTGSLESVLIPSTTHLYIEMKRNGVGS